MVAAAKRLFAFSSFRNVPDLSVKLAFLLAVPLCMALVLGWNGVGMLKPWPARSVAVLYWTMVTPGIWLLTYLILLVARRLIGGPATGGRFILLNCICALVSLNLYRPINSYFAVGFGRVFRLSDEKVAPPFPSDLGNFLDWQLAYLPFIALWVVGAVIADRLSSGNFLSGAPCEAPASVGEAKSADSLREYLAGLDRDTLISASAEDHYVRVQSLHGDARFHGRFSQALDLLEGFEGMRIHRSHWASGGHMRAVESGGGRAAVVLSDGRRLPVSAGYRDAVVLAVARNGAGQAA